MEYYVHHVPGRLRVRIPDIRNNPSIVSKVRSIFDIYGIDKLKINSITGSVVVTFDPCRLTFDQLLQLLKDEGLFDSSLSITCDQKIERLSNKAASKVGRAVVGYAMGKVLEANGFRLLAALI